MIVKFRPEKINTYKAERKLVVERNVHAKVLDVLSIGVMYSDEELMATINADDTIPNVIIEEIQALLASLIAEGLIESVESAPRLTMISPVASRGGLGFGD